jgi:hypothetical protein
MKKKLPLLTIMPAFLWLLAINSGYSQCDLNNEVENAAPLYFSYTHNISLSNEELLFIENWMTCDIAFENKAENCFYLEDWMLNRKFFLLNETTELEDWMMDEVFGAERGSYQMELWMIGFETFVESALYKIELGAGLEGWMLENNMIAQQLFHEAIISITDWMISSSFNDHENVVDLEDWMIDGLSMN